MNSTDFVFRFFAIYVQRPLIFPRCFLFIVTTCFGLIVLTGKKAERKVRST
jgi:hypothetical protein